MVVIQLPLSSSIRQWFRKHFPPIEELPTDDPRIQEFVYRIVNEANRGFGVIVEEGDQSHRTMQIEYLQTRDVMWRWVKADESRREWLIQAVQDAFSYNRVPLTIDSNGTIRCV